MRPNWIGRNQTSRLSLSERFWEKVNTIPDENGCLNWVAHTDHKGYGVLRIKNQMVHSNRVAWMVTNGEIPDGLFVCHKCDNRICCNPDHLFLGTARDNNLDRDRKGRTVNPIGKLGEESPLHKLTTSKVLRIRKLYSTGKFTYYDLADKFNISYQNVGQIVTRKSWKHV